MGAIVERAAIAGLNGSSAVGTIQLINEGEVRSLVDRTLCGDPTAWSDLMEAHGPAVWRLCCYFHTDQSDAEDLYQTTFERALKRLQRYTDGSFRAWLLTICRNRWRDELDRRKVRSGERSLDGLAESSNGAALAEVQRRGHLTIPDHQAAVMRTLDIRAALDSLVPEEREAVVLLKMLGLDSKEAAGIVGLPPSTLRSRMTRGLGKLKALLAEYRWEPR